MRVADSMDAMMYDRPYRKALTADMLRKELLACRGSAFDPNIIDAVLQPDCWNELVRLRKDSLEPVDIGEDPLTVESPRTMLRAI